MAGLQDVLGAPTARADVLLARVQARPVQGTDEAFLRALHAGTRAEEMRATGWSPSRCRAFLDQQFDFQQHHQRVQYPDALFLLLQHDGQAVGRLSWHSGSHCARLIELSLMPTRRGRGLGSAIFALLAEVADQRGQCIRLHVEPNHPARRLCERNGFVVEHADHVHLGLRRPGRCMAGCLGAVPA